MQAIEPSSPGIHGIDRPAPGARNALLLLLAINLFNYLDRQVLAAVEPQIQEALLPNDAKAGVKMGLLSSAFLVSYMCLAPLFGWLADRTSRWILVGVGVMMWSLASGASGLAHTFELLFITRCFVGVGEAAYGPVAPAMISDLYPVRIRGGVLSYFYAAIPFGSAMGYVLGDLVAKSSYGWRWAFYSVVPPGLLLGLICFLMKDPPRGSADGITTTKKAGLKDYLVLLRTPSYVLDTLGMAAMTFAMGGLAFWMSRYLQDRGVEKFLGMPAVAVFGAMTALAGLLGTVFGGWLGDRLRPKIRGSYFIVSGVAMTLGCPLVLLVVWTEFDWAWLFIFLSVFCLFVNTGPTNTILANVVHPSMRGIAFAANIFVIHILGDVISPPIIGWVKDSWNLGVGFAVVSFMMVVGGLLWLWGAWFLERDTALAPTRVS